MIQVLASLSSAPPALSGWDAAVNAGDCSFAAWQVGSLAFFFCFWRLQRRLISVSWLTWFCFSGDFWPFLAFLFLGLLETIFYFF